MVKKKKTKEKIHLKHQKGTNETRKKNFKSPTKFKKKKDILSNSFWLGLLNR